MTRFYDQADPDLCRALLEYATEAIIFADCEGLIRLWNPGSEVLFGYTANEVIGESLDIIIPERLRCAHWDGYRRALAAGHTLHGRRVLATRSMHKNGDKLYVELSFSMVKDAQDAVIGAMAVGRDITARYLKEKGQALSRDQSDGT
ncbi:MAG: PAS domain S-box protein [Candidatus Dechloromonas phosphoritropha]|jgi:PAS domain S-box-containing protein